MDLDFGQMMADLGATANRTSGAPASVATQPTFVPSKPVAAAKLVVEAKPAEGAASAGTSAPAKNPGRSFFTSPLFLSVVALMIGGVIALIVWQVFSISSKVSHLSNNVEGVTSREKERDGVLRQVWQRQVSMEQQASTHTVTTPEQGPGRADAVPQTIDQRMKLVAQTMRMRESQGRESRNEQVRQAGETVREEEKQKILSQVRSVEAPPPRRRKRAAAPPAEEEPKQEESAPPAEAAPAADRAESAPAAPRRSSRKRKKNEKEDKAQ